jgi:hypothetical protein
MKQGVPIMHTKVASAAMSSFVLAAILLTANNAHALFGSDACRNVVLAVDNNFGQDIRVRRFELWSASEGRWLNENFRDIDVRRDAQNFVVEPNEDIEYGENDRITQLRVHFDAGGREWVRTDTTVTNPICVAGRRYRATINR